MNRRHIRDDNGLVKVVAAAVRRRRRKHAKAMEKVHAIAFSSKVRKSQLRADPKVVFDQAPDVAREHGSHEHGASCSRRGSCKIRHHQRLSPVAVFCEQVV